MDKVTYVPAVYINHNEKEYKINIELPGVKKEDISFEITSLGFCLNAPSANFNYSGCWALAHETEPEKSKAKFKNGLLTVTIALKEHVTGKKVVVE